MNNDLKKYQIENMVFQAKQTEKDIVGLGKLILSISVVGLIFFSFVL